MGVISHPKNAVIKKIKKQGPGGYVARGRCQHDWHQQGLPYGEVSTLHLMLSTIMAKMLLLPCRTGNVTFLLEHEVGGEREIEKEEGEIEHEVGGGGRKLKVGGPPREGGSMR